MIFGIGTDIIETERMGRIVARGKEYLETIFTKNEIEYCESKARKSQHYAARYAAKQAALKALSVAGRDGLAFSDIEVIDDERGKPQVFVYGRVKALFERNLIERTSISLSHSSESAIAVIILEKQAGGS